MSESTLVVRRTLSDDWSELRDIRLEALRDTPDAFGSTYEEALAFSDDEWRTFAQKRCFYLAERDARVVGMISGGLNDAHPGTHWMYGMFVTPLERGTGTAQRLVSEVDDWARGEGASELFLHVGSTVARARAFYLKLGFEPTGETFVMHRNAAITLITMKRSLVES
ncbi:MAG TPA: GNAT family N-acetyltransferase [Acidimicrobiales bacterium]|nr:GNAT family N-acetyltransferase [Acidimicrobiales bacterium]